MRTVAILAFVLLTAGVRNAAAQLTAQINGTIRDATGAVVPGAKMAVSNEETGIKWSAESNSVGYYSVPLLQPGSYRIQVEAAGFRPVSRAGVKLAVAQTAIVDFALELGNVTESVEVTAAAPLLDASTNAIGQVVDTRSIENLPTNGRNSHFFMMLTPGVRAPRGFRETQYDNYNSQFVSINGARPNQNVFYIDGGNNSSSNFNGPTYTPSVDVVEEFKVQTNNFSAEYTNAAGGVVNLVTKSGTNQFHGSLYEFLRNDKLAANDFFLNRAGLAKTPFRFNQFGGTVGGPIIRNRTFFFAGYEGVRNVLGNTYTNTMPTGAQKAGDFSQTLNRNGQMIAVYDPLTTRADPSAAGRYIRSVFPGNRVPENRIDPVARNLLQYFPAANAPGEPFTGNNNFVSNATAPKTKDDLSGRIDHQFTDNTRMFVRTSYNNTSNDTPHVYGNPGSIEIGLTTFNRYSAVVNATHTFSPTFLAEVSSAFNRWDQDRIGPGIGFDPTQLGLPASIAANSELLAFPVIQIVGMAGTASIGNTYGGSSLGGAAVTRHAYDRFEERANLTKIRGVHTFKFGALFGVSRQSARTPTNNGGVYSFSTAFTQGPDPLRASANAGFAFASFLLGAPGGGSHPTTQVGMSVTNSYMGGYFQDDVRVTSKLTLNLGIRYDYIAPWTERYNSLSNFDSNGTATLPNGVPIRGGLAFVGVNGLPRGAWDKDTNNFAPRFGFAYSLDQATVLRGGYGVFFAQMNGGGFNSNAIPNTGFNCTTELIASIDGGLTPYSSLSNPFPRGFCHAPGSSLGLLTELGQNLDYADRNDRNPYSQQWSFDVQRSLPGDMLIDVAYSGNRGAKLIGTLEENQLPQQSMTLGSQLLTRVSNPYAGAIATGPLSAATTTLNQLLRPYPQFLAVTSRAATYGSSIYHALQLKFEKRFSRSFSMLASYTWSKLIDDVGATTTGFPGESFSGGGLQNYRDRRLERALAVFDTPHNFVLSYVWELPFGKGHPFLGGGGVLDKIVGGWQLNGITTFQSGVPLQVTGGNASQAFGGTQRPNWTGRNADPGGEISSRLGRYFDTSAFYANEPFTFGNAPRLMSNLRSAGSRNFDASFFKNIPLHEGIRLQFRAEFFNIFNTPQFGLPNTNFNAPNFGVVGSQVNAPRDIQFALKLLF